MSRDFNYGIRIDKNLRDQFDQKVNEARDVISLKRLKPFHLTGRDAIRAFIINSLNWDSEQLGAFIVEGKAKEADRIKEHKAMEKERAEMLRDLHKGYENGWVDRDYSDSKYENYSYRILIADLFRRVIKGKTTIQEMEEKLSLMPAPEIEE